MDERALAERLMTYDSSTPEGLRNAAAFVQGWLDSHEIRHDVHDFDGLPVILGAVGPREGPTVVFHGHIDVVPAHTAQFTPVVDGDRLIGRGAYDMKGGLAAMMCALADVSRRTRVRVLFMCVPDEESEDVERRSTDTLVAEGLTGDFAITGEPTDLHIGVQAKGVLALRLAVHGTAAHGSTPWLGDNAILKAHDVFRRIETLPFSRESSELFDRPSISLNGIEGGDAFNKVPDRCEIDVDIRYLPNQEPEAILEQIRAIDGDIDVLRCFTRAPAIVPRSNPYVLALRDAVGQSVGGDALSVGRDGASDAVSFLQAGVPAVEFGPVGGGHHGPQEWVSIASLARYRSALASFVERLPAHLDRNGADAPAVPDAPAVTEASSLRDP
jgi:succinyl-diaminopimelate desuccinylase